MMFEGGTGGVVVVNVFFRMRIGRQNPSHLAIHSKIRFPIDDTARFVNTMGPLRTDAIGSVQG